MAFSEVFPAHVGYKPRADFASKDCMKIVRLRAP